jgi:Ca2+-binding RTX toxin-like protein
MKRAILIATVLLCVQAAPLAHADPQVTMVLAGGEEADSISIGLSADGRDYVIDSSSQLEVGGTLCGHPAGMPNELICEAAPISGFEVHANGGDDVVLIGESVLVPVTLEGGSGNDSLEGGSGADKLVGDGGADQLVGGAGDDDLAGGYGEDTLFGGSGADTLLGEAGADRLHGGPGRDLLVGSAGADTLYGGPGNDILIAGGADKVFGGSGHNTVEPGPAG